jgi:hypothetical protein
MFRERKKDNVNNKCKSIVFSTLADFVIKCFFILEALLIAFVCHTHSLNLKHTLNVFHEDLLS